MLNIMGRGRKKEEIDYRLIIGRMWIRIVTLFIKLRFR